MTRALHFEVRVLDADGIDAARSFAHDAYILGEQWQIPDGDRAGNRVVERPDGLRMLVTDFDAGAKWFGVFDGDEMIACTRASRRVNGRFDADVYPEAVALRALTGGYSALVEWGRSIIRPNHQGQGLFPILCKTVLEEARRSGCSVLTTTRLESVVNALLKVGFPENVDAAVKYDGFAGTYRVFLADLARGDVDRVIDAMTDKVDALRKRNVTVAWAPQAG